MAAGVTSSVTRRSARRCRTSLSCSSTMGSMLAMDSAWNVMTSSIRLRNSGRNVLRNASLILLDSSAKLFAAVSTSPFMTFSMTSPMVSF